MFPEVPTSREDDQFLKEISVKIQMTDPKMVSICLTQLQEEVLEDFPPEILLQKPDIFKVSNYKRGYRLLFLLGNVAATTTKCVPQATLLRSSFLGLQTEMLSAS